MPVTKKVDTDTLVAKYRAYPNKKNTKVLKKFMAARRKVWNHFLGIQNQYYDKINEYILNQIDQSQLDEIKNTFKEFVGVFYYNSTRIFFVLRTFILFCFF